MRPSPVQRPRPPITIGATGQSMLEITARYADTWNSVPGDWHAPLNKKLEVTRQRNELLDEYCREISRNPQTLRRSVLVFGSEAETVFNSTDTFGEVVKCYRDVGINEFIFYYPFKHEQIPVFEQIAREVIPKLRAG